jgi:uncharacterized membrane protein YoaK (UPF0700 family)
VLLAVNSGGIDAFGFVSLGGAFTSVMTGNMILTGIAVSTKDAELGARSALAIAFFMSGAFVGTRIARAPQSDDPVWPRPVTVALALELLILSACAVVWWTVGGHPSGGVQLLLLAAYAVALGLQSSAILRFGVSGLSTTYMTGTLTTLVSTLAQGRHPRNVVPSGQILLGLVAGAGAATLLAKEVVLAVPLLQLLPVVITLVIAHFRTSA